MCDSFVITPGLSADGALWFGKNSDREPGEAQVVEHLPGQTHLPGARLQVTHLEIPQVRRTREVLISRPRWMWGAEMGANEKGLVIGNEAVFTRVPVDATGLTGMDLVRLALERAEDPEEAIDLIVDLIARHGQGGRCGYRNHKFRYHSAFILADRQEAWVLETAGPFWATQRVQGIRTLSNALSIGKDFDGVHPDAYTYARERGWCKGVEDFDFARCFGDPLYRELSGGVLRSRCTFNHLYGADGIDLCSAMSALRDHGDEHPAAGWRMKVPCAHASWWPTRHAGQTTGSMINRLSAEGDTHWMTGTSSPCLSVFKPVTLGGDLLDSGPTPGATHDSRSLFWRHEALHRQVLRDYDRYAAVFGEERRALQEKAMSWAGGTQKESFQVMWDAHLEQLDDWLVEVRKEALSAGVRGGAQYLFDAYWSVQNWRDRLL